MSEIESVSDEELTRIAKGMEEKKAEAVPQKPYMVFEAGEVVQESGLPGVKYEMCIRDRQRRVENAKHQSK